MTAAHVAPVEDILRRQAARWRALLEDASHVADAVEVKVAATSADPIDTGLRTALSEFTAAVTRFEATARHPEVVIATTGTTSSGKSTIANLLIGERLLPKAVQEMSAGIVAVRHDDDVSKLEIEETRAARWGTGTWEGLTADEIRGRLKQTMDVYRTHRLECEARGTERPEPPRFEVTWPTRIGKRASFYGLPRGARLSIVDLPGLKFIGDDVTSEIVADQVRKAMCLIAYNSFETDSNKQDALLGQVVDQVKALQGSPARMLFVLNRIDAFLTDPDPTESELDFRRGVTGRIRSGVRAALPEHSAAAKSIEPVPLSSEPALYATIARNLRGAEQHALLRTLAREYAVLFPDAEMERLPRSPENWSGDQLDWFLNEADRRARADEFESALAAHIGENLPEILVPELVDTAYRSGRKVLRALDALVESYSVSERAQSDEAKRRLERLFERLKGLQKDALATLNPLREAAAGDGDLVERVIAAVAKVESALDLVGEGVAPGPLAALQTALPDAVQVPLQRLSDYVVRWLGDEGPEDPLIEAANVGGGLVVALERLKASPYARVWRSGGSFSGAEADRVTGAVNDFARSLSSIASDLVARESKAQASRMVDALNVCGRVVVGKIEDGASDVVEALQFQGLEGVFRGGFELAPPVLARVRFSSDIERWSRVKEEKVTEHYWVEQRVWWKLWLGTANVKKTRTVVVERTEHGVRVSRLSELLDGFAESGGVADLEATFGQWLVGGLNEFDTALSRRLGDGVATYRRALEERSDEIDRDLNVRISTVALHRQDVTRIARQAESALDWRKVPADV